MQSFVVQADAGATKRNREYLQRDSNRPWLLLRPQAFVKHERLEFCGNIHI